MSNFEEEVVDGFADAPEQANKEPLPSSPDPGRPADALEPLTMEEQKRLEEETQDLVDGEPGNSALESDKAKDDYGTPVSDRVSDIETNEDIARPTEASPTAGGASAGANTAGIGQGTTDFDEEDSGQQ